MTEQEFWWKLRLLINSFESNLDFTHGPGYCDWFEIRRWVYGGRNPRIEGRVGFVNGRNAYELNFTLMLVPGTESDDQIEWEQLLPVASETNWLRFDHVAKALTIGTRAHLNSREEQT